MEHLPWWLLPSVAALILVGTHTYLGLHVISRNVFFVDLALAQIAALGSTVAYLFGFEMTDPVTYWVSLLFAVGGAWFFSVARVREDRVPQEAIIGLAFAVASAGAILLSAENPHGAEHLRDIMAGSILVVSGKEVLHAALFYGAIGVVHWIFRKRFLIVSMDRESAVKQGVNVQLWDFLFYLSFAVVITSSVRIAGVLLVFILLIAPAVCGAMFAKSIRSRLLIGWACGILATIGGLVLSARMDWPPAPAISTVFALVLVGSGAVGSVVAAQKKGPVVLRYAGYAVGLAALGFGLTGFLKSDFAWSLKAREHDEHRHGRPEHGQGNTRNDLLASLHDEHDNVRAAAAEKLGKLKDPSVVPNLIQALRDPSAAVMEKAAEALGALGRPEAQPGLEAALEAKSEDDWLVFHVAEALARCGGPKGITALIKLSEGGDAKVLRDQALASALAHTGRPSVKDSGSKEGKAALRDLGAWWKDAQSGAQWDALQKRFTVPR